MTKFDKQVQAKWLSELNRSDGNNDAIKANAQRNGIKACFASAALVCHVCRMLDKPIPNQLLYGQLKLSKRKADRQKLQYQDADKINLCNLNHYPTSWEKSTNDMDWMEEDCVGWNSQTSTITNWSKWGKTCHSQGSNYSTDCSDSKPAVWWLWSNIQESHWAVRPQSGSQEGIVKKWEFCTFCTYMERKLICGLFPDVTHELLNVCVYVCLVTVWVGWIPYSLHHAPSGLIPSGLHRTWLKPQLVLCN